MFDNKGQTWSLELFCVLTLAVSLMVRSEEVRFSTGYKYAPVPGHVSLPPVVTCHVSRVRMSRRHVPGVRSRLAAEARDKRTVILDVGGERFIATRDILAVFPATRCSLVTRHTSHVTPCPGWASWCGPRPSRRCWSCVTSSPPGTRQNISLTGTPTTSPPSSTCTGQVSF